MKLPNLLMIAGTGRESGKTTLACRILQKFSCVPIIAIKVGHHRPDINPTGKIIAHRDGLYIAEETNKSTGKDSSRMLAAGAARSFFMVAEADRQMNAVQKIFEIAGPDALMVCETGGLRKWIEPGLFLLVTCVGQTGVNSVREDLLEFETFSIPFDGCGFGFNMDRIVIEENRWVMKSDHDIL